MGLSSVGVITTATAVKSTLGVANGCASISIGVIVASSKWTCVGIGSSTPHATKLITTNNKLNLCTGHSFFVAKDRQHLQ
jgi:hypothetical protein